MSIIKRWSAIDPWTNQSTESTVVWRFRVIVKMSNLQNCIKLGQNIYLKEKSESQRLDQYSLIPILKLGQLEILDHYNNDATASTNSQVNKYLSQKSGR